MQIRASCVGVLLLGMFLPALLFAQELRITGDSTTVIDDPTVYRAYYGNLNGGPGIYTFEAPDEFEFSLVILTPDLKGARTDFIATVNESADAGGPFAIVDGTASEWVPFFDTAGRDNYLAGPILQTDARSGSYEIRVSNRENKGAYVLLIGKEGSSAFSVGEIFRRYSALPKIKTDFFNKPAYEAFLAPLLLWPIIVVLIVLTAIAFVLYLRQRRRGSAF